MDYQDLKIKKLNGNVAEIEGEITVETIEKYEQIAIQDVKKEFEMPGFRKGQVPENIIKKNVDPIKILENASNLSMHKIYPSIIKENDLEILGTPIVSITKLAPGNPVAFKITVGLKPEVTLPDYKKIARETMSGPSKEKEEATKEEEEELIEKIKKMKNIKEITEETIKEIGSFQNVDDFKEKIKKNIISEKEISKQRQLREEMAKKLIEKSRLEIPQTVLNEEFANEIKYLSDELKKRNLTIEDYLKKSNKTEKQFIEDKKKHLENQIKIRFIIEEIARKEEIVPDKEEVEQQTKLIQMREPQAEKKQIENFVSTMTIHEKTLQFLESIR